MSERTKKILKNIFSVIGSLGLISAIVTLFVYFDGKKTTIETIEKATVEKLSSIYENITKDMSYDEAFKIVFNDFEQAKNDMRELNAEIQRLNEQLNNKTLEIEEKDIELKKVYQILDDKIDEKNEKIIDEAMEYSDSGNYLLAIAKLKEVVNPSNSIEILIEDYTKQYETSIVDKVNSFVEKGEIDEANNLINEALKYISESTTLRELSQMVIDSQPQKMLDVVPAYQSENYTECTTQISGGTKTVSLGGIKYPDAMIFDTYGDSSWAVYNLASDYSQIDFVACHIDGTGNGNDTVMQISLDGIMTEEIKLSTDMAPKKVVLNVKGVNQLKIAVKSVGYFQIEYGIGDPIIRK